MANKTNIVEKKRQNWTPEEEAALKRIFYEKNISQMLDTKTYRKDPVWGIVVGELRKCGFIRTIFQVKQKWQNLKREHYSAKKHNNKSGNDAAPVDELMSNILDHRPSSILMNEGLDTSAVNNINRMEAIVDEDNDTSALAEFLGLECLEEYGESGMVAEEEKGVEQDEEVDMKNVEQQQQDREELSNNRNEQTPRRNKSKGRGSYAKTLGTFYEKWVESSNTTLENMMTFFKEQNQKQREWEEEFIKSQREHDEKLVLMNNAVLKNIIENGFRNRIEPLLVPNYPATLSPTTSHQYIYFRD